MRSPEAPNPPPGLRRLIVSLAPEELAFAALSPLFHGCATDWNGEKSAAMKVRHELGRVLHTELLAKRLLVDERRTRRRLTPGERRRNLAIAVKKYARKHWDEDQFVRAGNWLLACVLSRFSDAFVLDDDGLPRVTKGLEENALELYAECVRRRLRFPPATEPPPDWTGWKMGGYGEESTRTPVTFVRDPHPETQKRVRRAFTRDTIGRMWMGLTRYSASRGQNKDMLPVVEQFAVEVSHENVQNDMAALMAARLRLKRDLTIAKDRIGGGKFYVLQNCDFRGRVYGVSDFNFQREDHIRAMFRFAKGAPIGKDGLRWLAIHVANCGDFGGISKRPFRDRLAWADDEARHDRQHWERLGRHREGLARR